MLNLIKKISFTEFNLLDPEIVTQQRKNIYKFKYRWLRFVLCFAGIFITALVATHLVPASQIGWPIAIMFVLGILTIFFSHTYKCPNCEATPSGVSYSVTSNSFSYGKGLHPLPKRCNRCGFYLASRALKADLKKCTSNGL